MASSFLTSSRPRRFPALHTVVLLCLLSLACVQQVSAKKKGKADKPNKKEKKEDIKPQEKPDPRDFYQVLGVDRDFDSKEIKQAYRKLAMQWHPDKNPDNREEAEKEFRKVAEAYEVLSREDSRKEYDMKLKMGNIGDFNFGDFKFDFDMKDPGDLFKEMFDGENPFAELLKGLDGLGEKMKDMQNQKKKKSKKGAVEEPELSEEEKAKQKEEAIKSMGGLDMEALMGKMAGNLGKGGANSKDNPMGSYFDTEKTSAEQAKKKKKKPRKSKANPSKDKNKGRDDDDDDEDLSDEEWEKKDQERAAKKSEEADANDQKAKHERFLEKKKAKERKERQELKKLDAKVQPSRDLLTKAIVDFYWSVGAIDKANPSQVMEVLKMDKWDGKEDKMMRNLVKKYGLDPAKKDAVRKLKVAFAQFGKNTWVVGRRQAGDAIKAKKRKGKGSKEDRAGDFLEDGIDEMVEGVDESVLFGGNDIKTKEGMIGGVMHMIQNMQKSGQMEKMQATFKAAGINPNKLTPKGQKMRDEFQEIVKKGQAEQAALDAKKKEEAEKAAAESTESWKEFQEQVNKEKADKKARKEGKQTGATEEAKGKKATKANKEPKAKKAKQEDTRRRRSEEDGGVESKYGWTKEEMNQPSLGLYLSDEEKTARSDGSWARAEKEREEEAKEQKEQKRKEKNKKRKAKKEL